MEPIAYFEGPHRFLSNFYACWVTYEGVEYASVEHAYQAQKTLDPQERENIRLAGGPGYAKRLGRTATIRPHWDAMKVRIMSELLAEKFSNPELALMLKRTGDALLIEGNWWNDRFWGVCRGEGENMLGKLLMEVRDAIPHQAP